LNQKTEQKPANERAGYAERHIEPKALPTSVNNLASNESGDQTKYDPADDAHDACLA
jgi:hypothetical protein